MEAEKYGPALYSVEITIGSESDIRETRTGSGIFLGQRRHQQKKKRTHRSQRSKRYRLLQSDPLPGISPLVINISSWTLSIAEHDLLQKGLSFCPSFKFSTFDMDMDLHRFYRRLRLLVHFESSNQSPMLLSTTSEPLLSTHSLGLCTKSTFRPPRGSYAVETFISFIDQAFSKLRQEMESGRLHHSPNLSPLDFQALQSLCSDRDIIIKPADKKAGQFTVSVKLTSDPTSTIRNLIRDVLNIYRDRGVIDNKTQDFLTKTNPICPVFYILPKVHKNLEHPPADPLSHLQSDFLHEIQQLGIIPRDSLLVSLDVKDLYISIPHSQGILCVRHLLTNANIDSNVIAPPYAYSYTARFEEEIVYPDPLFQSHCLIWKRYIDDTGSAETLDHFFQNLNESWSDLTFTITSSTQQVSFLDTMVIKDEFGVLSTDLYTAYPNIPEFRKQFLPCYKCAPNIRDSLIRADIGPKNRSTTQRFLQKPKTGTNPCLRCNQCSNILKGDTFHHPHSEKKYKIKDFSTCDTTFVIYLIKCPCSLLYIGETTQPIKGCISKEKSTIRYKNMLLPIPQHFISQGHNIAQLKFQVIEHVPIPRRGGDCIHSLKRREA
ncbi:unnamed protein product [Ranitomeya imitator]|uniref:Reverse transcriptase domain-containing protein n=1 Tax=Ranitomeya imitator TaxID=111125 RepID=A0ABN9LFN0_9NEOB|nr:unnamed protein product [Ranitomeya imitator]